MKHRTRIKNFWLAFPLFMLSAPALHAAEPMVFDTPQKAVETLIAGARRENGLTALSVIGDDGKDILSSGDPVADENERENFLKAYGEKHEIAFEEGGNQATLLIGAGDWPVPVPIVKDSAGWKFDAEQGKQEILYRRIGRNELNTMQVILAYVDAQNEYSKLMLQENKKASYAQKIISSEGKHDGLYWPAATDETSSPLGELMAEASAEGYGASGEGPKPYHGYYYKILTRQGPSAKGGPLDYIVQDKMIGGFGLVAWPASYGNSGVMTFTVNYDGTVYQRNFGSQTEKEAAKISSFDPGAGWAPVSSDELSNNAP